jgi:hypothetical protein
VRHHFGIRSFGINAWTGQVVGDRILNAHDEAGDAEELYFVHCGRATFELDGERVDAPAGTAKDANLDPVRDIPAFKELLMPPTPSPARCGAE